MDVHPVVCTVDGLCVSVDCLEVFVRQQLRGFANVLRFENERGVEHERQELVESYFLHANHASRVAKVLQIRIDLFCAEQRLAECQRCMNHIESAMQASAASLQRIHG